MPSILARIRDIESKPTLYIGARQIECLRAYLDGWCAGVFEAGGVIEGIEQFNAFDDHLRARFRVEGVQGWQKILMFYSTDSTDALSLFFKMFNEFMGQTAK